MGSIDGPVAVWEKHKVYSRIGFMNVINGLFAFFVSEDESLIGFAYFMLLSAFAFNKDVTQSIEPEFAA